jgi:hypothetical protein
MRHLRSREESISFALPIKLIDLEPHPEEFYLFLNQKYFGKKNVFGIGNQFRNIIVPPLLGQLVEKQ